MSNNTNSTYMGADRPRRGILFVLFVESFLQLLALTVT